jgi:isopentenyl diphosphate isomerase/L-lactate dehydrogenase-like FMN-dependent dehydrogenase
MTTPVDLATIHTIDRVLAMAQEVVEPGPYTWAAAGAGEGFTVRRNRVALDHLALVPELMQDVSSVDPSTTVLGVPIAFPVLISPVGSTVLFHPDSAVAVAAGATLAGTSSFCATFTRARWEDAAATAPGRHFFQLYVGGDRGWLGAVTDRIQEAGFAALCVTVDSAVVSRRDALFASGFDWRVEREGIPENLVRHGRDDLFKRRFTWSDFEWLCEHARVPVGVKGILTARDAVRAVERGAAAVYVSNHGGRAVDHEVSTIEVLAEIIDAVGDRAEVLVDGGFQRGADVCKALALGAQAVAIGRLQCWGLALGGAAGVARVLSILHDEVTSTMALLGARNVAELTRDHVRWSHGVARPL